MSNFFKKNSRGANNIFHKVDHGASTFFTKTLPGIGKKISTGIQTAGDKIAGAGNQVGNFLEKKSAILGDIGGAIGMATGNPAMGASLSSMGNIGQRMGQSLKQGSNVIQNSSNRVGNLVQSQINNASNKALMSKNNLSGQIQSKAIALNSKVGMAQQQVQQIKQAMNGTSYIPNPMDLQPSFS